MSAPLSNYLSMLTGETAGKIAAFKRSSTVAHRAYIAAGAALLEGLAEIRHGQKGACYERADIPADTAERMLTLAPAGLTVSAELAEGGIRAAVERLRRENVGREIPHSAEFEAPEPSTSAPVMHEPPPAGANCPPCTRAGRERRHSPRMRPEADRQPDQGNASMRPWRALGASVAGYIPETDRSLGPDPKDRKNNASIAMVAGVSVRSLWGSMSVREQTNADESRSRRGDFGPANMKGCQAGVGNRRAREAGRSRAVVHRRAQSGQGRRWGVRGLGLWRMNSPGSLNEWPSRSANRRWAGVTRGPPDAGAMIQSMDLPIRFQSIPCPKSQFIQMRNALPMSRSTGTVPQYRLSRLLSRLSPSTK